MPTIKLTKRAIDDFEPVAKDVFYWDDQLKGFGVKVTPKGKKSFLVQYRPGGRGTPTRKVYLGPYGTLTLHQARTEATRILGQRAEGRDPAAERRDEKRKARTDRVPDVLQEFFEKHVVNNRTREEIERALRRDVEPEWRTRTIHEIARKDVIRLIEKIEQRGSPVMAKRLLAYLGKFFNWCVSRDYLSVSPCEGVSTSHREKSRDRILSDDEIKAIIEAARDMTGVFGSIIELLFLTAQRRREVAQMTWDEIDFDNALWTIPGERAKNDKRHDVHLSDQAIDVLKRMPKIGDYVFTSNGTAPFSGFSKSKRQLDELSGVTDWRLHDIRRTATSGMARLGITPHVADKILNHQSGTISGVAAVYQRHEFLDERKTALIAWGRYVDAILNGTDRDNVIAISG